LIYIFHNFKLLQKYIIVSLRKTYFLKNIGFSVDMETIAI